MNKGWYEIVSARTPITQGDIIYDCPLIGWKSHDTKVWEGEYSEVLRVSSESICADIVVLTQACDLENYKVDNIILCPHQSLDDYKKAYEEGMSNKNQVVSDRNWRGHCNDICSGFIWNLTMLNSIAMNDRTMDIRIVDFHYVYTVPRIFLESLLEQRGEERFRLLPPFREHLSQAFARFFMRVGLPIDINKSWQ